MTLLEKAKQIQVQKSGGSVRRLIDKESIELAVAWAKGEVVFGQVSAVVHLDGSNLYNYLACALREHFREEMRKAI